MRIECEDMADISIRTPAWGVTRLRDLLQPTLPISIRTPAWGVTIMRNAKYSSIEFQFAPPRGG